MQNSNERLMDMKTKLIAFLLVLALLLPTALSSVALEGEDSAPSAPSAQTADPFDYTSLYVEDSLIIAFSAAGKTAGDAPTSLTDSLGNSFSVGANAVWGDGVLLNRGAVLDLTSAQGTKLNGKSYTYEFVLGHEEKLASAAGSTLPEAFDIGVLRYKVVYTTENVTAAHAYMSAGTATNWVYDYGATQWTQKPFLDTKRAGEIIELSQSGQLDTATSKISFTTYRQGKDLDTAASEYTYNPSLLTFKLGKNLNLEIYAVRVYSDTLTAAERAQNHFADLCAYYGLDVAGYLALTEVERAKIHTACSSVRIDRTVSPASMQVFLDMCVQMKGNAPHLLLDTLLSFDGYSVSIWNGISLRAEFSLDESLLTEALSQSYVIECGSVVAPADAKGELIRFDEESFSFVAADPSYQQTVAYCSDLDRSFPEKVMAKTAFDASEALLYRHDQLLFKAYVGIMDGENSYVILFDAESERFGKSVSMNTLYEYFLLDGYKAYPSVISYVDKTLYDLLTVFEDDLTAAREVLAESERALADIAMLEALEKDFYASAQTEGRSKYDAYADIYTTYLAHRARKAAVNALPQKLTRLEAAIGDLREKIVASLADTPDVQDFYADKFTAALLEKHEALAEAGNALTVDHTLEAKYSTELFTRTQAARPTTKINKVLNGVALDSHVIFADTNERASHLLADTLYEEYGMLLPLVPEVLYGFVGDDVPAIHLDFERTHDVYGQSVLAYENETLTLYGNTQNGVYHAALKILSLFEARHKVTLQEKTAVEVAEVMDKTYAVDSFFRPDGTLDTDSSEPLTIVCIGGSLTELGKSWVAKVKEYFEDRFPNRPVTIYNAGVGGTGSRLGASRFAHDVLDLDPDLVIVEFSVNDASSNELNSKQYVENMIYQCLQSDKIPGIIYAHTPQAVDKSAELYDKHCQQVEWKGELAAYYGISVVNIYDYFYRCYEQEKVRSGNYALSYNEYISDIYKLEDDGTYDVHPIPKGRGYGMYADAFIESFERDLPSMLTRLAYKDILCAEGESTVKASHNYLAHNDSRVTYEDASKWQVWTDTSRYSNADSNAIIGTHRYVYPFMAEGVRRTEKQSGAAFNFKTTATDISFYYHGAKAGSEATVYVNGVKKGTVTTKTGAQQPFQTSNVSLGNPSGQEVTVRVVVNEPTASQYVFQFGYIIETFKP